MGKRLFALLLCLALSLSACGREGTEIPEPIPEAEPTSEKVTELWGFPIDNTHDVFEVPTGGRLGTVLVTVELQETDEEDELYSTISVWNSSNLTAPIQSMEMDGVTTHGHELVDADFDGHTDFCYTQYRGAKNDTFSLYIWDEERENFHFAESFLGDLEVDEKNQTLYNWTSGSISSGEKKEFRWENGELVCFRMIEWTGPEEGDDLQRVEVVTYERVNGEFVEVSREAHAMQGL